MLYLLYGIGNLPLLLSYKTLCIQRDLGGQLG